MELRVETYASQAGLWPRSGRHILAQYDDETIIVYQAYCPRIAAYAVQHRAFGDGFDYSRMSWIKPNFLWMMSRSGWGTKPNQEVTLALRLRRVCFDALLAQAVISSWDPERHATREEWSAAAAGSSVRLQWDPDHDPGGAKLERRAIQLGLRGEVLEAFGKRELLQVVDMSGFVAEQREKVRSHGVAALLTPSERVYAPADPAVAERVGVAVV